jgi:glutamyl-Q tRNA(Asp) synthetase
MNPVPTTRFAPSPTGYLHLGHAFAAISAARAAEAGRFLVRIENLDRSRTRAEYEAALLEDLQWLGLSWPQPVLRQSDRTVAYRAAIATLEQRGLLYPCFCTRREVADEVARAAEAPHAAPGVYPGTCRTLSDDDRRALRERGVSFALRLDAARAVAQVGPLHFTETGSGPGGEQGEILVDGQDAGDVVLARKELPAAYHLAVVLDDAFQGVTLVTRGWDLFPATHVQRLLQALLGLPPPQYAHHRLLLDAHGRKFSKREHALTLRALRAEGVEAAEVRRRIEQWPQ